MSTSSRLILASLLVSSLAYAEREEPPKGSLSMYQEGTTLYNRDFATLHHDLQRACVGDPSQKWLERLANLDAKVAKLQKAEDRQQFQAFLVTFRAWLTEKSTKIPDVGTWEDGRKAVAAMRELASAAPPAVGQSDAEIYAMIEYSTKVRASAEAAGKALSYAQNQLHGCAEYLGKPADLFPFRRKLDDNMQAIEKELSAAASDVWKNRLEPFRGALSRLNETQDMTTWWGHAHSVNATFGAVVAAQDIVAHEQRYIALGNFSAAGYTAAQAMPDAKRIVSEYGPKMTALIEEVSFPKANGKDPARAKLGKKVLTGRKVLMGPAQLPGANKQSFTEYEGGRSYEAKREVANMYFVVKPDAWDGPVPDGVQASDLCELRSLYVMRWTSGPPSRKKQINNWFVDSEGFQTPILCKNAKRITKLK